MSIGRYPRYPRSYGNNYRATVDRAEGPDSYFVTRDFADLEVLSQLAWFDEYFLSDSDVAALISRSPGFR